MNQDTPTAGQPTWESLGTAFSSVDTCRAQLTLAKNALKELLADPDIVDAQEQVKERKEALAAAEAVRDELGRALRSAAG